MSGLRGRRMSYGVRNANLVIGIENGELKFLIKSKVNGDIIVTIDEEDWNRIKGFRWYASKKRGDMINIQSRIKSPNKKPKWVLLHRIITGCPENKVIDHKDHNTLNNTKKNLRICSIQENNCNIKIKKLKKIKGCFYSKKEKKHYALIGYKNKQYHLGIFNTGEEATACYDNYAKILHGEFAYLNGAKNNTWYRRE